MMDLSEVRNYNIACGYTYLRLGIDGLTSVVTQQLMAFLAMEKYRFPTTWRKM